MWTGKLRQLLKLRSTKLLTYLMQKDAIGILVPIGDAIFFDSNYDIRHHSSSWALSVCSTANQSSEVELDSQQMPYEGGWRLRSVVGQSLTRQHPLLQSSVDESIRYHADFFAELPRKQKRLFRDRKCFGLARSCCLIYHTNFSTRRSSLTSAHLAYHRCPVLSSLDV